jgi:S-ribosylhomocysteine lyase
MSLLGTPKRKIVAKAWRKSMQDILSVKSESDIPELNIYQCGTYKMHSLKDAQDIASTVLKKGIGKMNNKKLKLDEGLLEGV